MNTLHPVMQQAIAPFMQRAPRPRRATSADVCRVTRECLPNHADLVVILTNLAAEIKKPCGLTDKCTAVVIDLLDSIVDLIEQDKVNQEAEA